MTAKRTASLHVFAFLFGTLTFIAILCGLFSTSRRTGRESFEYAELGDSSVNSHHSTVQTAYDKQIAEYEQASFLLQYIANSAPSDDLVVPQSAQPDASDMGYSNPYEDDPKYVGKKVCRSDSTYKDMAIPWFEVRQKLETNCSLIYGNLVLSGITDADDVTQLLNIEEISGYLVIHRVGRRTLQLPKLKIIRGQEYVPKRSRKIAFLVSNNYHQTAQTDPEHNRRMARDGAGLETAANDGTIAIMQHGVYFYDNPGLCYAPFTLKWDDLLETAETQPVELQPLHSGANFTAWKHYCQCQYLHSCDLNRTEHVPGNITVTRMATHSSSPIAGITAHSVVTAAVTESVLDIKPDKPLESNNLVSESTGGKLQRQRRNINNSIDIPETLSKTTESSASTVVTATSTENNPYTVLPQEPASDFSSPTHLALATTKTRTVVVTTTTSENKPVYSSTDNIDKNSVESHDFEGGVQDIDQTEKVLADTSHSAILQLNPIAENEVMLSDEEERTRLPNRNPIPDTTESTTTSSPYFTTANQETISSVEKLYTVVRVHPILEPSSSLQTDEGTEDTLSTIPVSQTHSPPDLHVDLSQMMRKVDFQAEKHYLVLPCHDSCPLIRGRRYCWGPERHQCQKIHKCQVRLCDGSNWCLRVAKTRQIPRISLKGSKNETSSEPVEYVEHCCHSECAGGCYGHGSNECAACLRYSVAGTCVASCPPSKIYDKSTFTWKENPEGRLTFGSKCVTKCPSSFLQEGDHCVIKCSQPGTYAQNGKCVPCPDGVCPKVCTMKDIEDIRGVDYLRRRSLQAMRNCTTFDGDIKLSTQSFVGDPHYSINQTMDVVRWEDLMNGLSNIREITGVLYISSGLDAPWLRNLTFLKNLRKIGGISRHLRSARAININNNKYLEFLGLTSLESIGQPSILITGNPNLCFVHTFNWSQFFPESIQNLTTEAPIMGKIVKREALLAKLDEGTRESLKLSLMDRYRHLIKRHSITVGPVYTVGNAHPEYCRGKNAICADECDAQSGCWGPGPTYCRVCRFWFIPQPKHGGRLCVRKCPDVEGYFTPGDPIPTAVTAKKQANASRQSKPSPEYSVTESGTRNGNNSVTGLSSTVSPRDSANAAQMRVCMPCSETCRLQKNACAGPGSDQCNGPCRSVRDGPYCRNSCPTEKYEDLVDHTCRDCAMVCSPPIHYGHGHQSAFHTEWSGDSHDAGRNVCTGPGSWPGQNGCNFCRQTVLRHEEGTYGNYLECVRSCPVGTYLHMVNLHYRGGSSLTSTSDPTGHAPDYWPTAYPWSHTDAVVFKNLPAKAQNEIANWLVNHTQPRFYGLAQICLPCHKQCYIPPPEAQTEVKQPDVPVCSGPSPEQCGRCANASYLGRCVPECPEGTYSVPQWLGKDALDYSSLLNAALAPSQLDLLTSELPHTSPPDLFTCLPCHDQCQGGCTGPKAHQCERCRRVKVFLDERRETWRCSSVCPSLYDYRVHDLKTGDIICSTHPDKVGVPERSQNVPIGFSTHMEGNISVNQLEDAYQLPKIWNPVIGIESSQFIPPDMAGLMAALAALLVFLSALGCMICWAISKQPTFPTVCDFEEDKEKTEKTKPPSVRLRNFCERLWTRGLPRQGLAGQLIDSTGKRKLLTALEWGEKSIINADPNASVEAGLVKYMRPNMLFARRKPNMATLRIITESQLIRGPLIGSGAFGTVFCGIWRPQSPSSVETLSATSPVSVTTSSTVTFSLDGYWNEKSEALSSQPLLQPRTSHSLSPSPRFSEHSKTSSTTSISAEIPVAIKVLTDAADPQTNKELLEEAKVMATVDHPCCLRFLALCLTSRLQLVTQFMPLGSLLDFIKTRSDLVQIGMLMSWSEQIASGMAYLASRGIIHRDLAARNVLVESLEQVRITDFGLAKCLDNIGSEYHATGGRMPIKWLAIECIQGRIFSSKSDVWSYGVTLWEMCTFGKRPFEDIRAKELLDRLENGVRLPQPETTGIEFYSMMLRCWEVHPNLRPTFDELCEMLEVMNRNPAQYLFITPAIRNRPRQQQQSKFNSTEAFEFLTNTLSSPSTSVGCPTVGQRSDSSIETEYTHMQAEWMKTLYVNSRITTFPECVNKLLDNNYAYLRYTADQFMDPQSTLRLSRRRPMCTSGDYIGEEVTQSELGSKQDNQPTLSDREFLKIFALGSTGDLKGPTVQNSQPQYVALQHEHPTWTPVSTENNVASQSLSSDYTGVKRTGTQQLPLIIINAASSNCSRKSSLNGMMPNSHESGSTEYTDHNSSPYPASSSYSVDDQVNGQNHEPTSEYNVFVEDYLEPRNHIFDPRCEQ